MLNFSNLFSNKKDEIESRVFVVGCPRSGTTLLQALLTAHSKIHTFPESHFFEKIDDLVVKEKRLKDFFHSMNDVSSFQKFRIIYNSRNGINSFIKFLDRETIKNNKLMWLEKTPGHLFSIKKISKYVKKSKFIHNIRDGEDVVASLYDLSQKFDVDWAQRFNNIDTCIYTWNMNMKEHLKYKKSRNHLFVRYESIVKEPQNVIQKMCSFLNISFEEQMLNNYARQHNQIAYYNEPWKEGIKKDVIGVKKKHQLFSPQKQKYIRNRLNNKLFEEIFGEE